jgi:3-phenylpropionate/trans-cinnamate dioxygenase ferredoxin subunit
LEPERPALIPRQEYRNRFIVPSTFVRAFQASEIPSGEKKVLEVEGKQILVCHAGDNFYAISNLCSHALEKMDRGRMAKTWIACPVHGARFELATGKCLNPPAKDPIATYEVRIVDDWIEVLV